jgi:hypothetical protein
MRHVGRATTAAPTYFGPARIDIDDTRDYCTLIDGGVFANNPAMCALVEAKKVHPEAAQFLVVSLGTGGSFERLPYEEARNWGLAQWSRKMLNVVFDGVSDTVDYQLRHLLPLVDGRRRYYRLQCRLDHCDANPDEVSEEHMRKLKLAADSIINNRVDLLDDLCGQLTAG